MSIIICLNGCEKNHVTKITILIFSPGFDIFSKPRYDACMVKARSFLLLTLLIAVLFPGTMVFAQTQRTLDNAQIQTILTNYNEPGYKFLEKIDTGMWKVLYARPGWDFGWEVIVTSTGQTPESALLVIGTTVTTTSKINNKLLMQLLDENSYDTNPGSYSIFLQDDQYFVQYAVKLPQSLISEDVLKEAIGFVAGMLDPGATPPAPSEVPQTESQKPQTEHEKPQPGTMESQPEPQDPPSESDEQ